jgi:pimeloyl-[acyl-carrier protein] synthase
MLDADLSLYRLLDPDVLADPYPLYRALRENDPVHWDPFLHAWVVTGYHDVVTVLHRYTAARTPTPDQLDAMGCSELNSIAQVMVKQMLFMDGAAHSRLRGLSACAFSPGRVNVLRDHVQDITNRLLDRMEGASAADLISEFAEPLPAIVTAEMLGVPTSDHLQLKEWSAAFAEMLGNFQHNPDRAARVVGAVEEMTLYFRAAIRDLQRQPREGLIHSLMTAELEGGRLSEEEVIANCIVIMVGGQETTTNLIGNGMLTLARHPEKMRWLREHPEKIQAAVEELLRYESPSQHTARLAPADLVLGGKQILHRQAVIAVMAAANRDPERFPDPDTLDLERTDNRHLAFGWAAHFCFGAPLARIEGQIAFTSLLKRFPDLSIGPETQLVWRENLGLRGLKALPVRLQASSPAQISETVSVG